MPVRVLDMRGRNCLGSYGPLLVSGGLENRTNPSQTWAFACFLKALLQDSPPLRRSALNVVIGKAIPSLHQQSTHVVALGKFVMGPP
jgi:hypothetical protein